MPSFGVRRHVDGANRAIRLDHFQPVHDGGVVGHINCCRRVRLSRLPFSVRTLREGFVLHLAGASGR